MSMLNHFDTNTEVSLMKGAMEFAVLFPSHGKGDSGTNNQLKMLSRPCRWPSHVSPPTSGTTGYGLRDG